MINYGNETIIVNEPPTEEELKRDKNFKGKETELLVSDLIIVEILKDELTFLDSTYQKIFQMHLDAMEKGKIIQEKELIHHEDYHISQLSIDLLSHPYLLSPNWEEKHHIPTETEDLNLKKAVLHSVHSLKLEKVNKMIRNNQEGLKKQMDEEEIMKLLRQQHKLNEAKKAIASELGRIVLK